jgi:hypothetical protein
MNGADEHEENLFRAKAAKFAKKKSAFVSFAFFARHSSREIEIRAAHEIMAARTT